MYHLVYAGAKTGKQFLKSLKSIPRNEQNLILDKLSALTKNPRPQQFKILEQPVFIFGYWAPCRLRIGDYRILYDIDEVSKKVVILALHRRSEKSPPSVTPTKVTAPMAAIEPESFRSPQ